MHRRVPRFHIDLAKVPSPANLRSINPKSLIPFPALQESTRSQQADKKSKSVPGIQVCGLQAVLRCTDIFQCELFNVDAKKATGAPGEHALVHEDVSCAYAMLLQGMVILTCPLQTLMQSLAPVESNNPLVSVTLDATMQRCATMIE